MRSTLTQALLAVHEVLAAADIPHALCGGLAANLYREEVRATSDVDLAIVVTPTALLGLVDRLSNAGWKVEPYWQHGEQLRLSRPDLPRVDCIIGTTDFERGAIERAVRADIKGRDVSVLTPEDLIVYKLISGRARDFEAVAAIINTQGDRLDVEYITGWLAQFNIPDNWIRANEEAQREAGGS